MMRYNEFYGLLIKVTSSLLPPGKQGAKIRGYLYKPFFKKCGKNIRIPERCYIYNPNNLSIGDNAWFGYNSYFGEGEIILGNNVLIGPFVSITASNHKRKNGSYRFTGYESKKIHLEDNVWIGSHSCILAGVKIGKGSLISAGSVVTKDVAKNILVGGVPAKEIKDLL